MIRIVLFSNQLSFCELKPVIINVKDKQQNSIEMPLVITMQQKYSLYTNRYEFELRFCQPIVFQICFLKCFNKIIRP